MAKVITFGEIMLRLAPEGYYRFFQNDRMEATFGGGEANVAVSLANYGVDTSFVTKLPEHAIGQAAVNSLRRYGVDTSGIVRGGERVGIYFLEKGASQRGSVCIYDRARSALQMAAVSDFDWETIPLYRDYSGPWRKSCGNLPGSLSGGKSPGSENFLRFELSGEALEQRGSPDSHDGPLPVCGCVYFQ